MICFVWVFRVERYKRHVFKDKVLPMNQESDMFQVLKDAIRTVRDYPKEGIVFYDITSLLLDPKIFNFIIDQGCKWVASANINKIVSVDARGFLFGAPIAYKLGIPLALVRKNNKLPGPSLKKIFETEYSTEIVEIQRSDIELGDTIVIIDDIIATGGTLKAVAELLNQAGAKVHSFLAIIGLSFLKYDTVLDKYQTHTLVEL